MAILARVLQAKHFDPESGLFRNFSFKRSSRGDKGISVIDVDCAIQESGSVCDHIKQFYSNFESPLILWQFDSRTLPNQDTKVHTSPGFHDDPCHRYIAGLSNNRAKKHFKAVQGTKGENLFESPEFRICENGNSRHLAIKDLIAEPLESDPAAI